MQQDFGKAASCRTTTTSLLLPTLPKSTKNIKTSKLHRKPLIMITLGPALFDNNNRLITLSGGYKNLHYLTQLIVTLFNDRPVLSAESN
jgi:hypothetical protein